MIKNTVFQTTPDNFETKALHTFRYQAKHNKVYQAFIKYLSIDPNKVQTIQKIPFLPIELFKTKKIITGTKPPMFTFTSSGTTGSLTSKHSITCIDTYKESFVNGFTHFYGNIEKYCLLALLPSYLERTGSSLVYMTRELIKATKHPLSGFYLHNQAELIQTLKTLEAQQHPTILLGVSYALWDLAEKHPMDLQHTIIMETGGMKGKRKELVREELHNIYKTAFGLEKIHGEYGMTELLSQAYAKGDGLFSCPPWMKVYIRELHDPFAFLPPNQTGGINIIDLANINSCSFIATQDLGRLTINNQFEVLGRFDDSDVRGCNLLVG